MAGTLCHFQKCDTFYHIELIGKFVIVNVAFHPALLCPVLFGLYVKEFHGHTGVEAIGVTAAGQFAGVMATGNTLSTSLRLPSDLRRTTRSYDKVSADCL